MEENLRQLAAIFSLESFHKLQIKCSRCAFAKGKVKLLRHTVSADRNIFNPDKIEVARAAPVLERDTALRSSLR